MTDHTRRAVLALGIATLGGGAGCISHPDAARTGPNEEPSETTTASGSPAHSAQLSFNHAEPLHRIDADFAQRDVGRYYFALLTSADHAASFPTDGFGNEEGNSFVTGTDFSREAVVVLQDRRSASHPDIELLDTRREGERVTIEAQYPGSGATADVTTDTLLVRLPTGDTELRTASAVFHPQQGEPVRFSTLNRYDTESQFETAGDLVLRNRDCADVQLSATVTFQDDLFFRDGVDLAPASGRRVGGLFAYAGEWTVTVRQGEHTTTRSWSLTDVTPGDVLVDVAGDGTVSLSRHPDGVDQIDPGSCETGDYPYESASPEENLDEPVALWVLDRSDGAHRLTVTIRDGDTEVFSDEFDTLEGYDKFKRAGLLAKKTTYTVAVTMDGGSTVSETVAIQEGAEKLVVRVSEAGTVTVSVE